jgi:hypothetical protein
MPSKTKTKLVDLLGSLDDQIRNMDALKEAAQVFGKDASALKIRIQDALLKDDDTRMLSTFPLGAQFLRNGQLCMRLRLCGHILMSTLVSENLTRGNICICNLKTGSAWFVEDEMVRIPNRSSHD